MKLTEVHNVLKQAEADYKALAQQHRQSGDDLTGTAKDAARDYEIRAVQCAEAAVLIEKAKIT